MFLLYTLKYHKMRVLQDCEDSPYNLMKKEPHSPSIRKTTHNSGIFPTNSEAAKQAAIIPKFEVWNVNDSP